MALNPLPAVTDDLTPRSTPLTLQELKELDELRSPQWGLGFLVALKRSLIFGSIYSIPMLVVGASAVESFHPFMRQQDPVLATRQKIVDDYAFDEDRADSTYGYRPIHLTVPTESLIYWSQGGESVVAVSYPYLLSVQPGPWSFHEKVKSVRGQSADLTCFGTELYEYSSNVPDEVSAVEVVLKDCHVDAIRKTPPHKTLKVSHAVGSKGLALRNKDSALDSQVLSRIPEGTVLTVLEQRGDWVKVEYVDTGNGLRSGWCATKWGKDTYLQ